MSVAEGPGLLELTTGLDIVKLLIFSYPQNLAQILAYVLCAQKNRLVETVLLNTHNIRFG